MLIFGVSGAVGALAAQFAKRRWARVIGTATGADATTLVDLGADGVGLDAPEPQRERASVSSHAMASPAEPGVERGRVLGRIVLRTLEGGQASGPLPMN